jgi:hypothetical protein
MSTDSTRQRSNFYKETTMSQKAHQNPAPKHTPTSEHTRQERPITGLSPDDDIGVTSPDTGQVPAPAPK